jgi:hypothetical protein
MGTMSRPQVIEGQTPGQQPEELSMFEYLDSIKVQLHENLAWCYKRSFLFRSTK